MRLKIKVIKLKLKKTKNSEKLSKKLHKRVATQAEEIVDNFHETIENLNTKSNDPNISDISKTQCLPLISNQLNTNNNENEKKPQRFKPYEKQKLPSLNKINVNNLEQLGSSNNPNRVCPWLIKGKLCGCHFSTDDQFNDHIKLHTTNELLTDLSFYYQAKNVLGSDGLRAVGMI